MDGIELLCRPGGELKFLIEHSFHRKEARTFRTWLTVHLDLVMISILSICVVAET